MNAELWQQPAANESAGNTYDQITDQPKAGALYDLSCKPSGNEANNEYDQQTFARHIDVIHGFIRAGRQLFSAAFPVLTGQLRMPRCNSIKLDRRGEAVLVNSEITYGPT